MQLAIQEGRRGAGFVAPNPQVGCVILDKNGELLATGFHERFGEAHAEINALKRIQDPSRLVGAHLFVTLEPCAHEGKTGSCAKALAQLPLGSVTFGLIDPFPQVAGKGQAILRAAGIQAEVFPELQDELHELCEVFLHNVHQGKPFVGMKVAASLDGQIAMATGESQWITNEESRARVQNMRGQHDGILVGVNTFLKDNPRLNSRDPRFSNKALKVVILDPQARSVRNISKSEAMKLRAPSEVILVTAREVPNAPCEILQAPLLADGQLNLDFVLRALKGKGISSVFVEGGAFVNSSFLKQKEVQRIYLFMAPRILGRGLGWTSHLSFERLAESLAISKMRVEPVGTDFLFTGLL